MDKTSVRISPDVDIALENERVPNFVIKKPEFSCPISPYIMWHHGMQFGECPLSETERDMGECFKCKLRGNSSFKAKPNKKNRPHRKKSMVKIEKRNKEPIPNIGKTYYSNEE